MSVAGQSALGVAEALPLKTTQQAQAAGGTKAVANAPSPEVEALVRDIIDAETEAGVLRRKCGQFSVEEKSWRSVNKEAPYTSLAGTLRDVRERLLAAQQDLNDTTFAHDAEAKRLREASGQVREELEVADSKEATEAQKCSGCRAELQEATRALSVERAMDKDLADTCLALSRAEEAKLGLTASSSEAEAAVLTGVAGQKARSQALFELAAERRAASAAQSELRGCEEALSEMRRKKEVQLESARGSAEVKEELLKGPAGIRLQAENAAYLESCKHNEEVLRKVELWQTLSTSSLARAEAAELKAERAAQRQAAAEAKAEEGRKGLEAAKPRLTAALEERERAKSGLQGARRQLRAASAAVVLALSFATATAMAYAGSAGS